MPHLGHPARASDIDSTVSLTCGGDAKVMDIYSLYALTLGKKWAVGFFLAIALMQFTMGMYTIGVSANKPGTRQIVRLLQVTMDCLSSR